MSPALSPLKASSSSSDDYERNNAKKSRLDDEYDNEGNPESEAVSPDVKAEIESNHEDEDDAEDDDKYNGSIGSVKNEHHDVGKAIKFNPFRIRSLKVPNFAKETDPSILARREKQIEYGKNTPEYANYLEAVPKANRYGLMPKTPNKHRKYSRRAWDGLIRQWRLNLHCWSDVPLEGLAAQDELKHDDSFCSADTNISTSTSSSIADAFTLGLGITSSFKEDSKPISRSESVSYTDTEENVDAKPDIKNVKIKVEAEDGNCEIALPEATVKSHTSRIKSEESDIRNTSWADEVDEYLAEEGLIP